MATIGEPLLTARPTWGGAIPQDARLKVTGDGLDPARSRPSRTPNECPPRDDPVLDGWLDPWTYRQDTKVTDRVKPIQAKRVPECNEAPVAHEKATA